MARNLTNGAFEGAAARPVQLGRLGGTLGYNLRRAQLAECAARHEAQLNAVFKPKQRDQPLALLTQLIDALDRDPPFPPLFADED